MIEENSTKYILTMANRVRAIFKSGPSEAGPLIESFMKRELKEFSTGDKINILKKIMRQFNITSGPVTSSSNNEVSDVDLEKMVNIIRMFYRSSPAMAETFIEQYIKQELNEYSSSEVLNALKKLTRQFDFREGLNYEKMADSIRTCYKSNLSKIESYIEDYVHKELKEYSSSEKLDVFKELAHRFESTGPAGNNFESKEFAQLLSLILGRDFSNTGLTSKELLERFSASLNTVFNTINEFISAINGFLMTNTPDLEQTIRGYIAFNIKGELEEGSLENHLKQIKEIFSVSHEAYREAAKRNTKKILDELDPNRISEGLKFGAFRKAYKEEFSKCKEWFESSRFNNDFIREFELICEKYIKKRKREIL